MHTQWDVQFHQGIQATARLHFTRGNISSKAKFETGGHNVPGLEQMKKAFGLAKSSRILFRPVPGLVSLKREHGEAITVKVNMNENANKIVRLTDMLFACAMCLIMKIT